MHIPLYAPLIAFSLSILCSIGYIILTVVYYRRRDECVRRIAGIKAMLGEACRPYLEDTFGPGYALGLEIAGLDRVRIHLTRDGVQVKSTVWFDPYKATPDFVAEKCDALT